MTIWEIIRAIENKINSLKQGSAWTPSYCVDGNWNQPPITVEAFDMGTATGGAWFRFRFKDGGGATHTVKGTLVLLGGHDSVEVDDRPGETTDPSYPPDVDVRSRLWHFRVRGIIEFKFELDEKQYRYRFDCDLIP
jgi:hypothetical protein